MPLSGYDMLYYVWAFNPFFIILNNQHWVSVIKLSVLLTAFVEGAWHFRDKTGTATGNGTLPDGQFSEEEIVLKFCCRNDGWLTKPISLPTNKDIILFPNVIKGCQYLEGMTSLSLTPSLLLFLSLCLSLS